MNKFINTKKNQWLSKILPIVPTDFFCGQLNYETFKSTKQPKNHIQHLIHNDHIPPQVWLRMPRPPPAEMPESMRKRLEAEEAAKSK